MFTLAAALLSAIVFSAPAADPAPFSFHVLAEPTVLDPQLSSSPMSNYLLANLYRGLLKYSDDKGLVGDGAKECRRQKGQVICELRAERKWSDGTPITAEDYVAAFRRLVNPETGSPQADVLFTVKNAKLIWRKEAPVTKLGVYADSPTTLRIELEGEDLEFEYRLIHPALSPLPPGGYGDRKNAAKQIVSGPYKIGEWKT